MHFDTLEVRTVSSEQLERFQRGWNLHNSQKTVAQCAQLTIMVFQVAYLEYPFIVTV